MDWHSLVKAGAPYGMGSMPQNPDCSVRTDNCSEAVEGDLCVWHVHRMGLLVLEKCGCYTRPCVVGDATGRCLRRDYEIKKAAARGISLDYSSFAVVDSSGQLYCCGTCQNADTDIGRCGDMKVCGDCSYQHTKLDLYNVKDVDLDEDPWGEWKGGCYIPETLRENIERGKFIKEMRLDSGSKK